MEVSKKLDVQESAHNVSYLGVKDGEAFLEIWHGIAMRKGDQYHTISVKVNLLPKSTQVKIKQGSKPWVASKSLN